MVNNVELYAIICAGLALVLAIFATIVVVKNKKLKNEIKLFEIALSKVQDIVNHKVKDELDNSVHQENFIKFISDSREWAYEYIEDVQKGITAFVESIEPEINYFDEYGIIGETYPHYHSMRKISKEYKELKKLLPVEDEE